MGIVVAASHLQLQQRVARVLDATTLEDGTPFMVMEFLEGRDLAAPLAERGPRTRREEARGPGRRAIPVGCVDEVSTEVSRQRTDEAQTRVDVARRCIGEP
jgi:aminoglycoside phosphotransferase (APT) family kinase protein